MLRGFARVRKWRKRTVRWLEHIDELEAGLAEAVREREPQHQEGLIDLDTLLNRTYEHPDPEQQRDRRIEL